MNNTPTEQLDRILKNPTEKDLSSVMDQNSPLPSLAEFFSEYMQEHDLKKSDVIKASILVPSYAYQILNGDKKDPARDKVIALCLSMKMDLRDTNRALKLSGASELYSKNNRDAIIIYHINTRNHNVMEVNTYLYDNGFETLR